MASLSSNTNIKNLELKPQWLRKKKSDPKITNLLSILDEKNKIEKQKRIDFLDSEQFSRKYDLPYKLYNDYINNSWFDIEYYSLENIEKRKQLENKLYNRADTLYDQFVDNYTYYVQNLDENSLDFDNFFYKDEVFIDDSRDRRICEDVNDILKKEFYSDYFNPFNEE